MLKKRKVTPRSAYLTKRILVRAARAGGLEAAKKAMKVMGHIVIAKDGWVVKKYADGRIENIERIPTTQNNKVVID